MIGCATGSQLCKHQKQHCKPSERQTMADDRIELARLRDCLRNCADELESEINARYGIPVHPAQQSRYERDLSTVVEARALLSRPQAKPIDEQKDEK